jgi:hypothetical protein
MLVDPSNSGAGARVAGAIRQASQATGASFNYLLATAQVESGLDPQAGASTSSARSLFQFIEQTWLATMKQSGSALGYGRYAAAITQTASGRYEVTDPALRNEILKLRNDPTANAVMAGAFTSTNAAELTQQLGRAPSEGELYIAHFLGSGGAARLIGIAASNPTANAAASFAGAARANPSIFHDHATGAARSVAQVRDVLIGRYNAARAGQDPCLATAQAAVAPAVAAAPPDTAGIANAFVAAIPERVANDTQVFHGLFTDACTSPLAPVVKALWRVPARVASSNEAAPAKNAATDLGLHLFTDPGDGS